MRSSGADALEQLDEYRQTLDRLRANAKRVPQPTIERPIGSNFTIVRVMDATFYFSYETCVAFDTPEGEQVVSENVWSQTTGKHLNWINPVKEKRVPHEEFARRYRALVRP